MAKNPLFELYEAGTSVWLDYIRRSLMTSGELTRMIEEDAVVGMTSNPTIFEKAIGGSRDYDDALRDLVHAGITDEEIMLSLIVEDIKLAADVLKPVYEQTKHKDGYVSIEVLPRVADDTQGTIAMAHDLYDRVGRPNIFVKIPATDAGLSAIEQYIAHPLNIGSHACSLVIRVDAPEIELLEQKLGAAAGPALGAACPMLMGKAAVAN